MRRKASNKLVLYRLCAQVTAYSAVCIPNSLKEVYSIQFMCAFLVNGKTYFSVIAEFYTKDEWLEQKMLASQSLEGLSDFEASKFKDGIYNKLGFT